MPTPKNRLVTPIHVDALHLPHGRSARSSLADFTKLPYLKKDQTTGSFHEINGDHPHIANKIVTPDFETGFWLRPGVHLHWSLPDGLTVGTYPQDVNSREQPTFPAVPNRWLVQRAYHGILQKQWLVESDFLYDPDYWEEKPDDQTRNELKRYLVAYPIPIAATGEPPFRYLGRQIELGTDKTKLATGEYLANYLEDLRDRGIDISDYPNNLTVLGYGEPTFAAFYPNSCSVFGLHDADFGTTPPPPGVWYEVYGWYERTGSSESLRDDPLYQLTKDIPQTVDSSNFSDWFTKTQAAIDKLEDFYRWRATFDFSSFDGSSSVVTQINDFWKTTLAQTDLNLSLKNIPTEPIRGREELQAYLSDPNKGGLDLRQSQIPLQHSNSLYSKNSPILSLENLIASYTFQVPEQLICYGQVWQDSFVGDLTPTHTQIFVGNTGTEAVAAFVSGELAVQRYPRQAGTPDAPKVRDAYTAVQIQEKTRLERFIEAIHLTPALNKQRVDIGIRLTEERHTKTFTAHRGSQLWVVKLATLEKANKQPTPSLEDNVSAELTLPPELAHQLNRLNQLQADYDQAVHQVKAMHHQIYADWYRYMLLAYPSDDEALDYEDVRLSPEVDLMIAYIKEQDIKPLQQAVMATGLV
ncbi:MAG: hypothetical protein F6K47_33890, partial [Symploca sp. SIO2E6]|nr:hypothetical protein [Symploca sp. SIO2E6]